MRLVNPKLRSLPNSVKDEVSVKSFVQRVKSHVLQPSSILELTSATNVNYVRISKPLDFKFSVSDGTGLNGEIDFPGYVNGAYANDVSKIGTIFNFNGFLGLVVSKAKYANITEARADLTGTAYNYQLAVPKVFISNKMY